MIAKWFDNDNNGNVWMVVVVGVNGNVYKRTKKEKSVGDRDENIES